MRQSQFQEELIKQLIGIREELHISNNRFPTVNISMPNQQADLEKIIKNIENHVHDEYKKRRAD